MAWRFDPSRVFLIVVLYKLDLDIIEYRDTNLETISILDQFGFKRNIDISRYRYIAISIKYRDIDWVSRYRLSIPMYFLAETSCTP